MATTPISTLKNWFKKGLKPLETQFAAWLDSYWHKDATDIPIGSISGLNALLSTLVEQSTITALLDGVPTPGNTLNKLYVLIQNIVGLAAPEAFSAAGGAFPTTYGGLAIKAGSPFRITSAGTLGATNPKNVNGEDLLIALVNNPTNNGNDWQIVESNRELATSSVLGLVKLAQSIVASGNTDETISTAGLKILLDAINTSIGFKEDSANKDASGGYVGLTLFKINFKNVANTFTSFFTNSNTASRTYTFQDRNGTIADDTDLAAKQSTSAKDASGGYVGLTLFKINFKNALNTFTSFFTNANTAARTYLFPDKDITVGGLDDIQNGSVAYGVATGTNTLVVTLSPAITSLVGGQRIWIKCPNTNSGAVTVNPNSIGAIAVKKNSVDALAPGDIVGGAILELAYDGTNLQAMGLTKVLETTVGGLAQDSVTLSIYKESNFGTP